MERFPSFSNLIPKSPHPWPVMVYDNWSAASKTGQESSKNDQATQQLPTQPQRQPTEHKVLVQSLSPNARHTRFLSIDDSLPSFFEPTIVDNYTPPEPAAPSQRSRHQRKVSIDDIHVSFHNNEDAGYSRARRRLSFVSAMSEDSWMDDDDELEAYPPAHPLTQGSSHTYTNYNLSSTSHHTFAEAYDTSRLCRRRLVSQEWAGHGTSSCVSEDSSLDATYDVSNHCGKLNYDDDDDDDDDDTTERLEGNDPARRSRT